MYFHSFLPLQNFNERYHAEILTSSNAREQYFYEWVPVVHVDKHVAHIFSAAI